MPLPQYGVAIGTFVSFQRDAQHAYGSWYHGHLTITTPQGHYESALDVDTPSGVGVSYRTSPSLARSVLGPVATLADGWHPLVSTSTSGAIDYLRSPFFQDLIFRRPVPILRKPIVKLPVPHLPPGPPPGPLAVEIRRDDPVRPSEPVRPEEPVWETAYDHVLRFSGRLSVLLPLLAFIRPWVPSTGDNALNVLEGQLPTSTRIYLFGEHYEDGTNGVHDVHMNQGDPAGSQWWGSDGIWQDGAVFIEHADGTLFGWQVIFNSQSMHTDAQGHPV